MKPCPKCGNESPQPQVDHITTRGPGVYHIYCPSCGEGVRANWRDDAEQKWDALPRRSDQPAPMRKLPSLGTWALPPKSRFVKLQVVGYDNSKDESVEGRDEIGREVFRRIFNPAGVTYREIYVDRHKVVDVSPADKGSIARNQGYGPVEWPDEPDTCYIGMDTNSGGGRLILGTAEEIAKVLE